MNIFSDWKTVVSTGHLIEAFSTMGQLHILDPTVSNSSKYYHINFYSYGALVGEDLEKLSLKMEGLGKAGHIKWLLDSKADKWKLSVNSCEKDFDIVPTASGDDKYHWIILLTDQMFYLKCNNVVVATVANSNDSCYPKIGKGKLGIGGWELTDMVGFNVRFENISKSNN